MDDDDLKAAIALSLAEAEATAARKRPRTASEGAPSYFPDPGCDASEFLPERGLLLRHGTSLSLMALVSEWLNKTEEFESVDPSADWEKWSTRRQGFSLYYAALCDPARDGADSIRACLRAVLDGVPSPSPTHRPRLVIDYVSTALAARGQGLATFLVDFVARVARMSVPPANVYVLATEDSCVYWMGHGYVLEPSAALNARLNVFNDTHLLTLSGDPPDAGDEADLELIEEREEPGEEAEEESAPEAEAGEEENVNGGMASAGMMVGGAAAGDAGTEAAEEADLELQAAIAFSLMAGGGGADGGRDGGGSAAGAR